MPRLLIVEDEADLRFSLAHNLEFEGYQTDTADNGPEGLEKARQQGYDLIILDIMLPGLDGLSVLKKIRTADSAVAIMMLTAKNTEMDKVIGFELGADDYLTKPFGLGEFLARVKALLRRNRNEPRSLNTATFLDFRVDFANYTVQKGDRDIHFSQKEFLLLKYLIHRHNQAVDKSQILNAVWGYTSTATSRTIDTHIARIRRKLNDRNQNRIIQTVPTIGYKFVAPLEP